MPIWATHDFDLAGLYSVDAVFFRGGNLASKVR
jgi:hypothetical protein